MIFFCKMLLLNEINVYFCNSKKINYSQTIKYNYYDKS